MVTLVNTTRLSIACFIQRHRNALKIPVGKSATKKSEKVDRWDEYNHRPTAVHRDVNTHQKNSKGFEPISQYLNQMEKAQIMKFFRALKFFHHEKTSEHLYQTAVNKT